MRKRHVHSMEVVKKHFAIVIKIKLKEVYFLVYRFHTNIFFSFYTGCFFEAGKCNPKKEKCEDYNIDENLCKSIKNGITPGFFFDLLSFILRKSLYDFFMKNTHL
jgi:hypothetical protein